MVRALIVCEQRRPYRLDLSIESSYMVPTAPSPGAHTPPENSLMRTSQLRRGRRRAAVRAMVGAVVLTLATGCGLLGAESDPAPGTKPTVKVTAMPILDSVPLRAGIEQELFTAQGIAVQLVDAPSGQVGITKLQSGEAHIAYAGNTAIVEAVTNTKRKIDLRIIAEAAVTEPKTMQIMVRDDGSVPSLSALAGKKLPHNGKGGVAEIITKAVMADHSVDYSQVQWTELKFPDMVTKLQSGDIDAALLPEPFAQLAAKLGMIPLHDPWNSSAKNFPLGSYVVKADWAAEHPAEVRAFQEGMRKAADYANADKRLIESIAVRLLKVDAGVAALMGKPVYRTKPSALELERVPDLMRRYGELKAEIQMAPLIIPPQGK
jgi:NitT/TauT family transport system substrate-binding protein